MQLAVVSQNPYLSIPIPLPTFMAKHLKPGSMNQQKNSSHAIAILPISTHKARKQHQRGSIPLTPGMGKKCAKNAQKVKTK
jgi:hypothetical protein